MAYGYWIKVYHDILDDHKVGMLPDATKWRFVACLVAAGENDDNGFLPEIEALAWRLRVSETELEGDLSLMARRGLVELRRHEDGDERWFVTHFSDRQAAMTHAERQKRYRNGNRNTPVTSRDESVTNSVTERHTDIDIDRDTDREGEKKQTARAQAPVVKEMRASSPRLSPPPVPEPQPRSRPEPRADTRQPAAAPAPTAATRPASKVDPAVADMCNAISETTGVSARLRWDDVSSFARQLLGAGYTAEQLRTHYGRELQPGVWNWYRDDWRGRDKGERPTIKNVTETIAGAIAHRPVKEAPRKPAGAMDQATQWLNRLEKGLNPT